MGGIALENARTPGALRSRTSLPSSRQHTLSKKKAANLDLAQYHHPENLILAITLSSWLWTGSQLDWRVYKNFKL
jgi:hypothetical protein